MIFDRTIIESLMAWASLQAPIDHAAQGNCGEMAGPNCECGPLSETRIG